MYLVWTWPIWSVYLIGTQEAYWRGPGERSCWSCVPAGDEAASPARPGETTYIHIHTLKHTHRLYYNASILQLAGGAGRLRGHAWVRCRPDLLPGGSDFLPAPTIGSMSHLPRTTMLLIKNMYGCRETRCCIRSARKVRSTQWLHSWKGVSMWMY